MEQAKVNFTDFRCHPGLNQQQKLEKLLTSLTKEDGTAMYEEKNFAQWVKDAAKKEEQAKNSKDEWAGVR